MSILDHQEAVRQLRAQRKAGRTLDEAIKILYDKDETFCKLELIGAVEEVEGVTPKVAVTIVIELLKSEDEDVNEVMRAAFEIFDVK